MIEKFTKALDWADSDLKEDLVKRMVAASISKPFTILTGGSGTGKTALACSLTNYLGGGVVESPNQVFRIGDLIGKGRAVYPVIQVTDDTITLENPGGTIIVFPHKLVQEWINAVKLGKITQDMQQKDQREVVKEGSIFDSYYHGWTAQLIGLGYEGADREQTTGVNYTVQTAIIPVGADWTDNRNVLGFVNHLRTKGDKPVYQSTPVLDLILEANENKALPYFLILDEMNLSHVERYFADFLSVMEQKNGKLQLHSEGGPIPRDCEDGSDVPPTIPYPQNLFVIGTVNVDETTYMFSPKVLDRANVIEFEVTSGQIDKFLSAPHEYSEPPKAKEGVAEAFLALAQKARLDPDKGGLDALEDPVAKEARKVLVALFEILKRGRFEFAYRTSNEVMRYLRVCRYLAAEESDEAREAWDKGGWRSDLDAQIVQKILPKLHGSMGRVGHLLGALAVYCGGATADDAFAYFPGGKEGANSAVTGLPLSEALKPVTDGSHEFTKSRRKLTSMIQVLLEEQFVSFIN